MGLFGGGALKRRVESLSAELETAQAEIKRAKEATTAAEKKAESQAEALKAAEQKAREAADALRKTKQKVDKANKARSEADKKAHALKGRVEHLQKEADEYRAAMLQARRDAEAAHAARLDVQRALDGLKARSQAPAPAPAPVVSAEPEPVKEQPRPRPVSDERLTRLQDQIKELRDGRDALKDRVAKAEQAARAAERKQRSESGRAESVLRDLRHNLRAERNAYRILQLQFETLLDRTKGVEQTVNARVAEALAQHPEAAPDDAASAPAESTPAVTAEVLPDAPVVGGDA